MSKIITLSFLLVFVHCMQAQPPQAPAGLSVKAYELHVELRWEKAASSSVTAYKIYRSTDGGANYSFLKNVSSSNNYTFDWLGDEGQNLTRYYKVSAVAGSTEGDQSPAVDATTFAMNDEQLFDMEQEAAFRYFWDYGHPLSGMARERNGSGNTVTTGGTGFGVMSLIVGVERGWISRDAAVSRLVQLVSFLQNADRFHGAFPHWMDGSTGKVIPFSQFDNGGDLVETAFLVQGLLAARTYFDQNNPYESAIRDAIKGIWEDVEWDWYRRNNSGVLYWHWSPNYQWQMNFPLRGFNETHIVYILAVASPTHPVPASLYQSGWTASNYANPSIQFGYPVYTGPFAGGPLFFAHYSYLGFDPRGLRDAFCNYFVRNRNHALIHKAYCIANPENHVGYSANCWGLTASDEPNGYSAHDPYPTNDNGTITPTAALASMPYTPAESMDALRHFYRNLGNKIWGDFGFYDAFNQDQNWVSNSYLAIDQGPIVVMMENQRSGLLWKHFMLNPEIAPALSAIGFVPDNSATEEERAPDFDFSLSPNPATTQAEINIDLKLETAQMLQIEMLDATGRLIQQIAPLQRVPAGQFSQGYQIKATEKGNYFIRICEQGAGCVTKQLTIQ